MSKTIDAYNHTADAYEKKFSRNMVYKQHIEQFAALFSAGDKILDAGCGPGLNARTFHEHRLQVTGVDASTSMIELARQNCPRGKFRVMGVDEINPDELYDGVCLAFIIVHLKDDETAALLNKLSGLLHLQGYVYLSFMSGKKPGYERTSFSDKEIYFNYYDEDAVIRKMRESGFELIQSDIEPYEERDGSFTNDHFLIFKHL